MSGIPPIVPKTLRDEVYKIQDQLKILINNHKILDFRLTQEPENNELTVQINKVKEYIFYYNQQQLYLLEKIREFLRHLEAGQFIKKQEQIPTELPKKKLKKDFKSISHSPEQSEVEEERVGLEYMENDDFYKGHVDSYHVECPEEYKDDIVSSPVKRFRPKPDLTNSNPDQNQFLLNLDLLESNLIDEYLSILRAQDVKKRQREFLYVPEVSDKKFRNQSFLLKIACSPPQLRRRKETADTKPRPARAITFPPERMETRKKNSMKQRKETEEQLEIEKLMKEQESENIQ
ncbi:uncharacterized protein LOC111701687 [Eurytemora carolleeae]|uniref:uncharacterized protein LOC111701687 n=1 Tax=Eurytemora carolleeae TaxID=1294199 RepID=UPI000C76D309|nr:uncharacterized protein LOC111701687 [Eurytemora carolleeae]XP_023328856.1 uncharacterized protein LOC111701687 [Eurytemora carolleeae]XP_023328857.1 uncharacterized protein LOC111701687 [Eurytemora carolleeae]XP_023328858.1 uncharacterized protein LOC111701687 [Eurytemora carolleeae]XP_023328859.1 uncharacterized protein LOC111701687 [Eurytemora carolleeae]|eukprot:XP_023328855.1 uncharacterized protein LOC111701687 [Eurytemora affinis]